MKGSGNVLCVDGSKFSGDWGKSQFTTDFHRKEIEEF